jgi:hypothetical protein
VAVERCCGGGGGLFLIFLCVFEKGHHRQF